MLLFNPFFHISLQICNSLGQCHCDQGHAPPYCNEPGYGGSLHSGPASSDQRMFEKRGR